MNYISVAQETKKIIRNREYEINGKTVGIGLYAHFQGLCVSK